MNLKIHIVSFDIPYPPNYGGVIDVYYKIKALHDAGVSVILHCFEYHRKPAKELEQICTEVCYYPRNKGLVQLFSVKPYIVASRHSTALLERLLQDDYPILFEGLHTCGLLDKPEIKSRAKIYRESNIEHHYYHHLAKASRSPWKKAFFHAESFRLKKFQSILRHADKMLTVSHADQAYLQSAFPTREVLYLPSFHRDNEVNSIPGKGSYALYQGKLSVPENSLAVSYIIKQIWLDNMPELVIAGLNPPGQLIKLIGERPNVRLVENPDDDQMFDLIQHAQINLMVTFQPTGLKLKLLNALFHGRFCLVNPGMLTGTGLDSVCRIATSVAEFRKEISQLFALEFTPEDIITRKEVLISLYDNKKNCKFLIDILTLL